MFGLPKDFDPSFFVGNKLVLISVTLHEIRLRFEDDIAVQAAGDIAVTRGTDRRVFSQPPQAAKQIVDALQQVAERSSVQGGTLEIGFPSLSVAFIDSEVGYESYQIHYGDETTVI